MLISELLDIELLAQHIANGNISIRYHNTLPLAILNYTAQTQYSWLWDEVTTKTRGLIYNTDTMEVVARPFEKFYNWDESTSKYPPSGPVIRMEKMDGSLGVLYPKVTRPAPGTVNVGLGIATRGSFHSEQAEWATQFINNLDDPFSVYWQPGKTYLFEIIYPGNRIVVDYGGYEGLVLIDVIDIETGFSDTAEFDEINWPDKVKRTPLPGFDSGQVVDIPEGDEGFVYLWPARNLRTKMKSAEYVALHRLVSNLSEKTIWESLVAGKTLGQIKFGLPEEFHGYIDDKGGRMLDSARYTMGEAYGLYNEIKDLPSRKAQAIYMKDNSLKGYVFKLLDGKEIWLDCIKAQKPRAENPLIKES